MFDMESNLVLDKEFGLESIAVIFSGECMLRHLAVTCLKHAPFCCLVNLEYPKVAGSSSKMLAAYLCCKQLFSLRWV